MFRRSIAAFFVRSCGIFDGVLDPFMARNEGEVAAGLPEPHTIASVTAHDPHPFFGDIPPRLRPFMTEAKLVWNFLAGLRYDDSASSFASSRPVTRRIEMVTTPITGPTKTFICKQLDKLPPVVTDWQQCQQPRCSHYCDGECGNSGRQSASAPCPFDGKELLLVDAEAV